MEVTYGHKVVNMDDEFIGYAERAGDVTIEAGSPGSNILGLLVDFFPIRKSLWIFWRSAIKLKLYQSNITHSGCLDPDSK